MAVDGMRCGPSFRTDVRGTFETWCAAWEMKIRLPTTALREAKRCIGNNLLAALDRCYSCVRAPPEGRQSISALASSTADQIGASSGRFVDGCREALLHAATAGRLFVGTGCLVRPRGRQTDCDVELCSGFSKCTLGGASGPGSFSPCSPCSPWFPTRSGHIEAIPTRRNWGVARHFFLGEQTKAARAFCSSSSVLQPSGRAVGWCRISTGRVFELLPTWRASQT